MTTESAILRAYALLSQGRYDEAEQMLRGAPTALNTPSGADLFARLRFEQGFADEAQRIWQRIHAAFPDFEPAVKALDAFENPPPDEEGAADESPSLPARLRVVAAIVAVAAGVAASAAMAIRGCHSESNGDQQLARVVTNTVERVETKVVDRCVTNFVDKVRTEFVDRIVTNVVERTVEVPAKLTLTNTIERLVCLTNQVTVFVTNRIDGLPFAQVLANPTGQGNTHAAVESSSPRKLALSTPCVAKDGDVVSGLRKNASSESWILSCVIPDWLFDAFGLVRPSSSQETSGSGNSRECHGRGDAYLR